MKPKKIIVTANVPAAAPETSERISGEQQLEINISKPASLPQDFEKKPLKIVAKLSAIFFVTTLVFACCYWGLSAVPGHSLSSANAIEWYDYLYFSVVTVSTLGYGDIAPTGISKILVCFEVLFGLIFVGYSLSQVLSARQEYLIEYLATDRILQTYSSCLATVADAKELLADRRRHIQLQQEDPIHFVYNRGNPFYPALKAMEVLNGYTAHVEKIGRAHALSSQVERAAHHVEELASFARKYLNVLISKRSTWRTRRTVKILTELCDAIDKFSSSYTVHTRYASEEYKGGGEYQVIVKSITDNIRRKL